MSGGLSMGMAPTSLGMMNSWRSDFLNANPSLKPKEKQSKSSEVEVSKKQEVVNTESSNKGEAVTSNEAKNSMVSETSRDKKKVITTSKKSGGGTKIGRKSLLSLGESQGTTIL